jgi:ubiquinone/menaquinone biosynthesis C-methylase UbiE
VAQLAFDDQGALQLEALYQTRDAQRRRRLVRETLAVEAGQRVLDAGCGPGFYCVELAKEVGDEGEVVGVDTAQSMLEAAARRCQGLTNVSFRAGNVLALPVDDQTFDRAVCVQVLEYVDEVVAALVELRRTLRAGGKLVVWDFDWATVSWHATDEALMDRLLAAWDQHLSHRSLPRTLAPLMREAGFSGVEAVAHEFTTIGTLDAGSYPHAAMPLIGRYVTSNDLISEAELATWIDDQQSLSGSGAAYFTCVQTCFSGWA